MSYRGLFCFVLFGELFAVGVQVWLLWEKVARHAPGWSIAAQVVSLTCLCAAAGMAIGVLWKRRKSWWNGDET